MTVAKRQPSTGSVLGWTVAAGLSAGLTAVVMARVVEALSGDRLAPWVLGRAGGLLGYLLLVVLVMSGLLLSHPWRTRLRRPATSTRIQLHALLAVLTATFTALHVIALSTDRYAGVGWRGAILPLAATYRPAAVSLGVIGMWSGLLAGATAGLAGRLPLRLWWPVHKIAALSLVACWLHAVYAGSDTAALRWFYLATAAPVLCVATSRYISRTARDELAERIR